MASGVTMSGSLSYETTDTTDPVVTLVNDLFATISGFKYLKSVQLIGISGEAITLGEVTTPGWAMFINRDSTNFIELRVATGGAKFAKLKPGEFALLRLGSGAQAPYALADTASCLLEYILVLT